MVEKWKKYKENIIPEAQYEITEILQNAGGTSVTLESERKKIVIKFGFVDALRACDEGRRIKTYNDVDELQNYRGNFIGSPLYLVDDSLFCKWIVEESVGFYTDSLHYAVVTMNDIIDVLSSEPPEIIVSDNSNV